MVMVGLMGFFTLVSSKYDYEHESSVCVASGHTAYTYSTSTLRATSTRTRSAQNRIPSSPVKTDARWSRVPTYYLVCRILLTNQGSYIF